MEHVLVFPASLLERIGKFQGVSTQVKKYTDVVLNAGVISWISRAQAENDPSWKQIIPYCILRHKGKVFTYQRTKQGGEVRLHDKYSLGVGGHINPCDGVSYTIQTYQNAFKRELDEEITLTCKYRDTIIGLIYDDTTPVGQVHFGVVHRLTLDTMDGLTCKDPALANGEWKDTLWLKANKLRFESWSQFIIEELL